jgi:hypothetical protein
MTPFTDITVYFNQNLIDNTLDTRYFQFKLNYLMDFYHRNLNGYKPPKTSRISIELVDSMEKENQFYFGSILRIYLYFNLDKYLKTDKDNQLKYLLDLSHNSLIETAIKNNWEINKFKNSYDLIINSKFNFNKQFDLKSSKDKKTNGQAIITKTITESKLTIRLTKETSSKLIDLMTKANTYWFDSIYAIASNCKWIDNDKFGYKPKHSLIYSYYSITDDKVISNLDIIDENI